jgi:hypothetical protein
VVVHQFVGDKLYILDLSEIFEERITRRGDEDLVVRIAEQAEDIRIGFTGAGGKDQAIGRKFHAEFAIVLTDGVARDWQTSRLGIVSQSFVVGECFEDGGAIELQPDRSGVGGGEVEEFTA